MMLMIKCDVLTLLTLYPDSFKLNIDDQTKLSYGIWCPIWAHWDSKSNSYIHLHLLLLIVTSLSTSWSIIWLAMPIKKEIIVPIS